MIKRSTKEDVEKEIMLYWKQESENPTVKDLFYEWINRKLEYRDICQGTFDRYEGDFRKFFEDESKFGEIRVRNIKSSDIVLFLRKALSW